MLVVLCIWSITLLIQADVRLYATTEIVPIRPRDWYPTLWGGSFEFYTTKLASLIDDHYRQFGPLALVGHSAGGWIAKICLGEKPYQGVVYACQDKVKTLVTLGTPHLSIEKYPFGRVKENLASPPDICLPVTAQSSSLKFVNYWYPSSNCFPKTEVVSIVGKFTQGKPVSFAQRLNYILSNGGLPKDVSIGSFAYLSYKANCGDGGTWGDGVCPLECGFMPGSERVILDKIYHGPNSDCPWYGSPEVLSLWEKYL